MHDSTEKLDVLNFVQDTIILLLSAIARPLPALGVVTTPAQISIMNEKSRTAYRARGIVHQHGVFTLFRGVIKVQCSANIGQIDDAGGKEKNSNAPAWCSGGCIIFLVTSKVFVKKKKMFVLSLIK